MKNHQVHLIKNTYSVEDARDVLFSLFMDKIKFLDQKIFSLQERFGSDTTHLENRVKELRKDLGNLLVTLKSFENEDHLVEIDCKVELKIKEMELS